MERVPLGACFRLPSCGCQGSVLSGRCLSCRQTAHFKWMVVVQRMDRRLPPFTRRDAGGIWLCQSFVPGADRVKEREAKLPASVSLPQPLLLLVCEGVQTLRVWCGVGPRDSCPCDSLAVRVSSVKQHQISPPTAAVASAFPP